MSPSNLHHMEARQLCVDCFSGFSLLETQVSVLLKYLIQLLMMTSQAHLGALGRLNNYLCQLTASLTRASH